MIKVLIADDQDMFRSAIRRLLELEGDVEVVAEVGRGDELLEAALASRPDEALIDIEMPGKDGLEATDELRRHLPSCRPLIVTMFGRPGFFHRAMKAGGGRLRAQEQLGRSPDRGDSALHCGRSRHRPRPRRRGHARWTKPAHVEGARLPGGHTDRRQRD